MKPRRRPRTFEPQRTSREEPVHERPSAALSVGLACSRTNQYAPRARPPSALHLAIPEQAPLPEYSDKFLEKAVYAGRHPKSTVGRLPGLIVHVHRSGWEGDLDAVRTEPLQNPEPQLVLDQRLVGELAHGD